ncbi:hypothetical protein SAMN05443634_11148 [Chishuiella changwenlii]|jgi:hypothetical protein|uniref:Uncharacterized protein n=1 Tax=Chishuiella changwenlii TaxID=1434701 RepID=A0A1M7BN95_9FLAO|nr:hypothetical protein [Chishuiella changwenlii]GGF02889.1 hypothetical protein GCM10010984_20410 [Chishuiella changwenlii]SHL56039.1 hypothetical protein SAMN05443634_11148 [Chishuiella changwenlii]
MSRNTEANKKRVKAKKAQKRKKEKDHEAGRKARLKEIIQQMNEKEKKTEE